MLLRYLKILLVGFYAVFCFSYGMGNVLNSETAYQSIYLVASQTDHNFYPNSLIPPITSPILVWAMVIIITGLQLTAGLVAAKGTWDLWSNRGAGADVFHKAKKYALLALGLGLILWFGVFQGIGGAIFYMYQTELGGGTLTYAFQYSTGSALLYLVVSSQYE